MQQSPSNNQEINQKGSIKNIAIFFAFVAITANALSDLFEKGKNYYEARNVQSYVPAGNDETNIDIQNTYDFESFFTQSVTDIIKTKGGFDFIPDSISYTKNGIQQTIDISPYKKELAATHIGLLNTRGSSEISHATGLIKYLQKDFLVNECILEEISQKRIAINPEDSYRDKVSKIQDFVRGLKNERDIFYLGENKSLAALSDYQLPSLANLVIGKMDCNNKTGLFIELCRANNILVGIGSAATHMSPVVYSNTQDVMWKYIKANTSIGQEYNGIVIDPSDSDMTTGVRRPHIAGDMVGDKYTGMKFVVAKKH